MQTFLQLVAQDLYQKIGNDLSRVAIVFPNKRASLFFNEYLAMQSDRPIWSPAYVSISELFRQLSPWKSGDPIRLVCELYKVFREETRSEETLDDFYFWGELLISDFDDVDKNLVDADRLFSNLQDLKNIMDDYDFLDSEQEEAIRQFFQNFSIERRTQLKEKFISLWDKLGDIYHHYRRNLEELGIAYEGMMYRYVMEELQSDKLKYEHYVFVGFNVLNKVETKFFERLREAGKALFYWDYDVFYTRLPRENTPPYTHEAGEFILRNLKIFPNELPEAVFDTLRKPKNVRFISAPTENAQARYLPEWIRSVTKRDLPETPVKEKEPKNQPLIQEDGTENTNEEVNIEEDNQEAAGMAESEFPEEETNAQINAVKEETGNETGAEKSVVNANMEDEMSEDDTTQTMSDTSEETTDVSASAVNLPEINFSEDTVMEWPVNGNVLLDYSMDQTTYYPTLDQYRLSPAISVGAVEGAPVVSAVNGTVYSVEKNAQTGTTLTMELGNGYQAIYGQLEDLTVSQGDIVKKGTTIGYVAEPTKYYSAEGANLYFAMKKDGEPIDPITYLRK